MTTEAPDVIKVLKAVNDIYAEAIVQYLKSTGKPVDNQELALGVLGGSTIREVTGGETDPTWGAMLRLANAEVIAVYNDEDDGDKVKTVLWDDATTGQQMECTQVLGLTKDVDPDDPDTFRQPAGQIFQMMHAEKLAQQFLSGLPKDS